MKRYAPILATALLLSAGGIAQAETLAMDEPVTLKSGATVVCTGIGEAARTDPRWKAFPIRVELANDAQQYLAGAHITLTGSKGGAPLADFDCDGAWVLFQVPSGQYDVRAHLLWQKDAATASARFAPPASGQKRVVLVFKGVAANQ